MLLPHHGFTILPTENPKVPIENSVSSLVFTKVLTIFTIKKVIVVIPYTHSEKFLHVFFEISEPSH